MLPLELLFHMTSDEDRPAALLTEAQRAYLRGEKEYRPSVESKVRQRIRERINASIDDISLLVEQLPPEELEKAVEEATKDGAHTWGDLVSLVVLCDEFLWGYGTGVQGEAEYGVPPRGLEFEIEDGIAKGLRKLGHSWRSIDVAIEPGGPLDELIQKGLEELSEAELQQLWGANKITQEELRAELVRRSEDTMDMEAVTEMRQDAAQRSQQDQDAGGESGGE